MVLLAVTVVGVVAMKAEYAAGEVGSIRAYRDTGNPSSLAAGWLEAVVTALLVVTLVVAVAAKAAEAASAVVPIGTLATHGM